MSNPNTLPQRKKLRLKNWDYSTLWWYFVTVCTQDRRLLFGRVVGAQRAAPAYMELNEYGKIVENVLQSLPEHHSVDVDVFQIMPNHVHFIVVLVGGSPSDGKGFARKTPTFGNVTAGSLPCVIRSFKSECTKRTRRVAENPDLVVWQRNYYEHIIRDEQSLYEIRQYISDNPRKWDEDRNNPKNW